MPLPQIREYARPRHEGDERGAARLAMLLAHSQRLEHSLEHTQRELAERRAHLDEKLRIYRRIMRQ